MVRIYYRGNFTRTHAIISTSYNGLQVHSFIFGSVQVPRQTPQLGSSNDVGTGLSFTFGLILISVIFVQFFFIFYLVLSNNFTNLPYHRYKPYLLDNSHQSFGAIYDP
jgi:hypothetical protein